MEKLYTSSEARKILGGISTSTFKNLVDTGKIRKITPPNKKQGFYLREDVDKIADEMKQFVDLYTEPELDDTYQVVLAKGESDIKETVQIARQHFGENAYGTDRRMAWFRRVPNGDYILKHHGRIVGYFSMQAIKHETVERIFKSRSGNSVQLEDMEPIVPGKLLELHISGIGIKTGVSRQEAKIYGMELLMGLFNVFLSLVKEGVTIDKIWVKSSTVPGIKLSRDLGFIELGYINNEQIGFRLDFTKLNENQNIVVKNFLKQYRAITR